MPDTTSYMILGYIVVVALLAALVGYLLLKAHNLRAELQMLEELENDSKAHVKPGQPAPRDAMLNKSS